MSAVEVGSGEILQDNELKEAAPVGPNDVLAYIYDKVRIRTEYHDVDAFKADMVMVLAMLVCWLILIAFLSKVPLNCMFSKGPLDTKMELDLRNRFFSLVHSTSVLVPATYFFLYEPTICGELNSKAHRMVMCFSMSYFIGDTIDMLLKGLMDNAMIFHHSCCIIGMLLPLYENIGGNFAMKALFFAELSNPAMNFRHVTRLVGRRYTLLFETLELTYFACYISGRLIFVIPTAINNLTCAHTHMLFKLS